MESVVNGHIFTAQQWREITQELLLTERQASIVEQLLEGHGDRQIARNLGMSMGTLRTHLDRMFRRFAVQDRFELTTAIYAHFLRKCRSCNCPRFL